MTQHTDVEYAVEVPDRGWYIGGMPPTTVLLSESPEHGVPNLAQANDLAYSVRNRYHALGCPEIAETVRVVSRTVVVTRGDWEPAWELTEDSP